MHPTDLMFLCVIFGLPALTFLALVMVATYLSSIARSLESIQRTLEAQRFEEFENGDLPK